MENDVDGVFDKEDLHNRFMILGGLNPVTGKSISPYVMMVKLKKAINNASDENLQEVNRTVFGERLPFKDHQIKRSDLVRMLEVEEEGHILKCLYISQQNGIVDAILCLLKKINPKLDQQFLRNYFLNPPSVSHRTMDDFE